MKFLKLSAGEIADRLSILEIKAERITGQIDIALELNECHREWDSIIGNDAGLKEVLHELKRVNEIAWDSVENIYHYFNNGLGDENWEIGNKKEAEEAIKEFRKAHDLNMRRIELKNEINRYCGSRQEIKTWKSTTN